MNADGTIEEGSSEEVGVTRTPFNLERPVRRARELADDLRRLGVPAERPVILAARQEHISILLAPRKRQDALFVASKNFLRGACVTKVPDHDDWRRIVFGCGNKSGSLNDRMRKLSQKRR